VQLETEGAVLRARFPVRGATTGTDGWCMHRLLARIHRYTLDRLRADIKPVGYHAWVNAHTLALYVLGQPATLQIADTATGKADVVASGVGRSIQLGPDGTVSFVKREAGPGAARLTVHSLDPKTRQTTALVDAPAGATEADLAWTPGGVLLVAQGTTLLAWRKGEPGFKAVADLTALGLRGATRLSVSPKGDRIAIVAQPR